MEGILDVIFVQTTLAVDESALRRGHEEISCAQSGCYMYGSVMEQCGAAQANKAKPFPSTFRVPLRAPGLS